MRFASSPKLSCMAEPARTGSSSPENFASLLASLTTAARANDSWDDTALADDVSIISYEQALRSVRPLRSELPAESPAASTVHAASAVSAPLPTPSDQKHRRTASITIRVSEAEQAQLHERAAAAKLSISAYLRSCIFEAEALRAQVKEALAQMQSAGPESSQAPGKPATSSHRRFRLFSRWSRRETTGN